MTSGVCPALWGEQITFGSAAIGSSGSERLLVEHVEARAHDAALLQRGEQARRARRGRRAPY